MSKPDKYHYHEFIDRTHCIQAMIEELVQFHPVTDKHKELRKLVEKAQKKLGEAYQLCGNIDFDLNKER